MLENEISYELLEFLNRDAAWQVTTASYQRILAWMSIVRKIHSVSAPQHEKNYYELMNTFDTLAERYASVPMVHHGMDPNDRDFRLFYTRRPLGRGATESECVVAEHVVTCARGGTLDRVRQCCCGKWFFAIRRGQKFHISRCRHRQYEQTEAFKERRRLYMCWYYAMYQSAKAPAKKLTFTQWLKQQKSTARRKHRQA